MANIKPNKGRRRRLAMIRFTASLIEELEDVGGHDTQEKRRAALETVRWGGDVSRYHRDPSRPEARAPQLKALQQFENKVAEVLKRPAHTLKMYDLEKSDPLGMDVLGLYGLHARGLHTALRGDASEVDVEVGYEADWPTYSRLKHSPVPPIYANLLPECARLFHVYAWQYGVLWDAGVIDPADLIVPMQAGEGRDEYIQRRTKGMMDERILLELMAFEAMLAQRDVA